MLSRKELIKRTRRYWKELFHILGEGRKTEIDAYRATDIFSFFEYMEVYQADQKAKKKQIEDYRNKIKNRR